MYFVLAGLCVVALVCLSRIIADGERRGNALERELTLGNMEGAAAIVSGRWDGVERRQSPRLHRSFPVRIGRMP